jgi:hypothetical protein
MKEFIKAAARRVLDKRVVIPVAVTAVTAVTLMVVQQKRADRLEDEGTE